MKLHSLQLHNLHG